MATDGGGHFRNGRYPSHFRNEEPDEQSDEENLIPKPNATNGSIRNSTVNYIYNRYVTSGGVFLTIRSLVEVWPN